MSSPHPDPGLPLPLAVYDYSSPSLLPRPMSRRSPGQGHYYGSAPGTPIGHHHQQLDYRYANHPHSHPNPMGWPLRPMIPGPPPYGMPPPGAPIGYSFMSYHQQLDYRYAMQHDGPQFNQEQDLFAQNETCMLVYDLAHDESEKKRFLVGMTSRPPNGPHQVVRIGNAITFMENSCAKIKDDRLRRLEFHEAQIRAHEQQIRAHKQELELIDMAETTTIAKTKTIKTKAEDILGLNGQPTEFDPLVLQGIASTVNVGRDNAETLRDKFFCQTYDDIKKFSKDAAYDLLDLLMKAGYLHNKSYKTHLDKYLASGVISEKFYKSAEKQMLFAKQDTKATLHALLAIYFGVVPEDCQGFECKMWDRESPWTAVNDGAGGKKRRHSY